MQWPTHTRHNTHHWNQYFKADRGINIIICRKSRSLPRCIFNWSLRRKNHNKRLHLRNWNGVTNSRIYDSNWKCKATSLCKATVGSTHRTEHFHQTEQAVLDSVAMEESDALPASWLTIMMTLKTPQQTPTEITTTHMHSLIQKLLLALLVNRLHMDIQRSAQTLLWLTIIQYGWHSMRWIITSNVTCSIRLEDNDTYFNECK